MVDIQSATAEIKRGKKEEATEQKYNIMSAFATHGGHNRPNYQISFFNFA